MKGIRKISRKLLPRFRKPKRPLIVTSTLPYLRFSCDFLSSVQSTNGSWSNDLLTSALVLRALKTFSISAKEKSSYKQEIGSGVEYLRGALDSLSDEILKIEELYGGLDRTAIDFGNAISTLWFTKSLKNDEFLQKIRSAFSKIESDVAKFIKSLDNIEVTCTILNCYMISPFTSTSKQILDFAISRFFSKDLLPKDAFLLIITFKTLQERVSSMLEEKWNRQVSRRTDVWKNMHLNEGLEKLVIDKSTKAIRDKALDIATLSYGLIAINRLKINAPDLQERIIEEVINRINILKKGFPLLELGLLVWALSESPIVKVAFFPLKESDYVTSAIKWFEKMKVEKIKTLESTQYNLLISFVFILICSVAIMSYLAFSNLGITLSILFGLLSAFYFLINWLSRKKR